MGMMVCSEAKMQRIMQFVQQLQHNKFNFNDITAFLVDCRQVIEDNKVKDCNALYFYATCRVHSKLDRRDAQQYLEECSKAFDTSEFNIEKIMHFAELTKNIIEFISKLFPDITISIASQVFTRFCNMIFCTLDDAKLVGKKSDDIILGNGKRIKRVKSLQFITLEGVNFVRIVQHNSPVILLCKIKVIDVEVTQCKINISYDIYTNPNDVNYRHDYEIFKKNCKPPALLIARFSK